jgi:hypothetical protein
LDSGGLTYVILPLLSNKQNRKLTADEIKEIQLPESGAVDPYFFDLAISLCFNECLQYNLKLPSCICESDGTEGHIWFLRKGTTCSDDLNTNPCTKYHGYGRKDTHVKKSKVATECLKRIIVNLNHFVFFQVNSRY